MYQSSSVPLLDRSASEPLWSQLATIIKSAIDNGDYKADQALPSESELISRFGVSRTVVREALSDLVQRGIIYKIRAKGSFVSPKRKDLNFVGSISGSADDLNTSGRSMRTKVLSIEEAQPTPVEAKFLQLAKDETVVRISRLRSVDSTPWLLVHATLPARRLPGLAQANLENASLYEHLRRYYDLSPAGADRWVSAVEATPEQMALMNLPRPLPLLHIESVTWDDNQVPFEYYNAYHRTDETRFYLGIR